MKRGLILRALVMALVAALLLGCCGNAGAITFSETVEQVETKDLEGYLDISLEGDVLYYGMPITIRVVLTSDAPEEIAYVWKVSRDGGETWELLEDEHTDVIEIISAPENDGMIVDVLVVPAASLETEAAQ